VIDFSSKLAKNNKLTSNEYKKHLKNNLCLYCRAENFKLDSYSKKKTKISLKSHSTSGATDPSTAASKKLLEKQRAISRTLYRLRAILNFPI